MTGIGLFEVPQSDLLGGFNQGGWTQPNGGKLGLTGLSSISFPTVHFNQGYTPTATIKASENLLQYGNVSGQRDLDSRPPHSSRWEPSSRRTKDNYRNFNNGGGTFNFQHLETSLPGVANSGNAWASFLVGAVDNGNAYFRASLPGGRYKYFGSLCGRYLENHE